MRLLGLNVTRAPKRKEDPTWRAILAVLGSRQAISTPKNYANLAKAGYQLCATGYACVSLIAKSAASVPWGVYKRNVKGDLVEDDKSPLGELLAKPNEYDSGSQFVQKVISYKLLAGNSYVLRVGVGNMPPRYLYSMRPDRMTALPGDGKMLISGWQYEVSGRKTDLKTSDVLHLKEFHPLDDFYGLSKFEVAAMSIDLSNEAAEWNLKLLQNNMRPSGAFRVERSLTDEQYNRQKAQFKELHGAERAGEELLLEGGMDYVQLSLNPKDMDWLSADKFNMRRICSVFNVASELLGDSENKTYSNVQEARQSLYTEAVLPELDQLRDGLNSWLAPLYGDNVYIDYDRDSIEALQEDRGSKYAYLGAADWMTINEKRVATGYDEVPGGDTVLVSFSRIPLEQISQTVYVQPELAGGDGGGQADDQAGDAAKRRERKLLLKGFWQQKERQEILWKSFEQRVRARERSFEVIARCYIKRQGEAIATKLYAAQTLGDVRPELVLNLQEETRRYVKQFRGWYTDNFIRAGNAGMRAAKGELFDDAEFKADKPTSWMFHMTPAQEEKLAEMIFNSGTEVNEATIAEIRDLLKAAQDANMTVEEFTQKIISKVEDFETWRSRLWARTESAKVDNFGQLEGYRQTEFVDRKGWLCSFLPTSRKGHETAGRRYYDDTIPLNEAFSVENDSTGVWEDLQYPGDPAGGPGNVCNCLCAMFPDVGE